MLFEKTSQGRTRPVSPESARLVDGVVRGHREVWVVLAAEDEMYDWLDADAGGEEEVVPYRVCREILDDGSLVLADSPEPSNDSRCEITGPVLSDLDRLDD